MTLRLANNMEVELENLAYVFQLSKAGTLRKIIRRAVMENHQNEIAILNSERQGGVL